MAIRTQHSFAITNSHLALSVGHFMTPRELRHKDLTHCDDSPQKTGLRLLVVSQLGWGILQGLAILPKKNVRMMSTSLCATLCYGMCSICRWKYLGSVVGKQTGLLGDLKHFDHLHDSFLNLDSTEMLTVWEPERQHFHENNNIDSLQKLGFSISNILGGISPESSTRIPREKWWLPTTYFIKTYNHFINSPMSYIICGYQPF